MATIDIPLPAELTDALRPPICLDLRLPMPSAPELTLPIGGTLQGVADITRGTPNCLLLVEFAGDDRDALRGWFERLSEGGEVTTALEKQMWGDEFGQLTDRFGIGWLVNIAGEQSP